MLGSPLLTRPRFQPFALCFLELTCYLRQRREGGNEGRGCILERETWTVPRFSWRGRCSNAAPASGFERAAAGSVTSLQRDYLASVAEDGIALKRNKTNREYWYIFVTCLGTWNWKGLCAGFNKHRRWFWAEGCWGWRNILCVTLCLFAPVPFPKWPVCGGCQKAGAELGGC